MGNITKSLLLFSSHLITNIGLCKLYPTVKKPRILVQCMIQMIILKGIHLNDLVLYGKKDGGLKDSSAMFFEPSSFQKIAVVLICPKYVSARSNGKHQPASCLL